MAHTFGSGWKLPAGVFNPVPDLATLPVNLVIVGMYIASSVVLSALTPPPHIVLMFGMYFQYVFGGVLAVMLLFGIGMICLGWLVADNPTRYTVLGKTVMRASHIVLVFSIALREVAGNSRTPANK